MSLIVHAWTAGPGGWQRRVTDGTGVPLGAVCYEGAAPGTWFPWLRRIRLHVLETEDASHLMTLVRTWGLRRSWHVEDAEAFHVGTLHWGWLISSEGVTLGHLDSGRIVDSADQELASYRQRSDAAMEVTFTKAAMDNPFLRMLLLGSILALAPTPT